MTQLFSSDAELLNLGDFADILIEENQVGTTVKVDDQNSDPYAILSIINLNQQKVKTWQEKGLHVSDSFFNLKEKEGVKQLCTYLGNKCPKKNESTLKSIKQILSLNSTDKHVGWVVSERFINMPVEIMAPMYNMLQEEINNAVKQVKQIWIMYTKHDTKLVRLE